MFQHQMKFSNTKTNSKKQAISKLEMSQAICIICSINRLQQIVQSSSNSIPSANVTECVLNEPLRLPAVSRDSSYQLLYSNTFRCNDFNNVLLPVKYSVSLPRVRKGDYSTNVNCPLYHSFRYSLTSSVQWFPVSCPRAHLLLTNKML